VESLRWCLEELNSAGHCVVLLSYRFVGLPSTSLHVFVNANIVTVGSVCYMCQGEYDQEVLCARVSRHLRALTEVVREVLAEFAPTIGA